MHSRLLQTNLDTRRKVVNVWYLELGEHQSYWDRLWKNEVNLATPEQAQHKGFSLKCEYKWLKQDQSIKVKEVLERAR